ncbi:MAG: peptidogalycan biosysnthesis protein, partial [Thiohalobacterales bacterium]|nr:peptidogalycan biosysnthesis protein [Thiohalobacterales bacterium]
MQSSIVSDITAVPAADWNRIAGTGHPFLRHEFLAALERHGCVGEAQGWVPCHITVRDADDCLRGIAPLYLKYNSYGEFVFDWAWADAWHRAGLDYYPKLVSAIPYTPVTGPRLLVDSAADGESVRQALISAALALVEDSDSSTLHWLFTSEADTARLQQAGFLRRTGCHFHWHNRDYRSFEDFLAALSSRKRKK